MTHGIKQILFCFFIFNTHIIFPTILKGTLLKTPSGLVLVENLSIGDILLGYRENNTLSPVFIIDISLIMINKIIVMQTNKGEICVAPDQLFWNDSAKRWIPAHDVTQNMFFLDSHLQKHRCLSTKSVSIDPVKAYKISTTYPHNFFITKQEVLAHNFLPFVGLGISALFGGGLEFGGVSAIISIAGIVLSTHLFKKRTKSKGSFTIMPLNNYDNNGGHNKKPDDEEDNKNERRLNIVTKTTFFKKMKDRYKYWRDNIYRKKPDAERLDKKVEYIKWDHLHNDVEAYDKGGKHLGSYDPKTLQKYKPANPRNYIDIR